MGKFFVGLIAGILLAVAAVYIFIAQGGVPMNVSASSQPMERFLARTAITASMGKAGQEQSPIQADETNLLAGAHIYQTKGCAGCHGHIDDPHSGAGKNFYPLAPHLLPPSKGVTDDEVGETHWVVKNGIRFSAMPTYNERLSDTELWQVSLLLHNADKLPASVQAVLREGPGGERKPAAAATTASPSPAESASPASSATPAP
ncbi:MAG: cytochrome c [Verrucomicrobia bacterium]|nr:cytochrome c [Verrucomicrobiota bacterium]